MSEAHESQRTQKQKPSGVTPEGLIAETGQLSHRF